jgi:hypothetical protein
MIFKDAERKPVCRQAFDLSQEPMPLHLGWCFCSGSPR